MSYYYPQAFMVLDILFEDFKLSSSAIGQKTSTLAVQTRSLDVTVNDYRTADTFKAEVDYKHFPFDPRSMRSCAVSIYLQDMARLYNKDGSVNKIRPNELRQFTSTKGKNSGNTNAIFTGFVDEDEINFDDMRRTVSLSGRDQTGLFIDQMYSDKIPTDPFGLRLDQAIKTLVRAFPALNKINIVNQTDDALFPLLRPLMVDPNSQLSGQRSPGKHENYWEIIQDMINRCGLIGYMNLNDLIITTPRNQLNTVDDLKIVYGKNVKNLNFKRKLGRLKKLNLQCISRSGKNVIKAEVPLEATDAWCKSFGIKKERVKVPVLGANGQIDPNQPLQPAPIIVFPIPGIANKEHLIRIAQNSYEEYSRQQLEGSFDTHEMLGRIGVSNDPFDLTKLDIGHPLQIEIDMDDLNEISRITSVEQRIMYLTSKGYDSKVAVIFAESMGKFSPRFFTKSLRISMGDSGFKLHVDFINILDLTSNKLVK